MIKKNQPDEDFKNIHPSLHDVARQVNDHYKITVHNLKDIIPQMVDENLIIQTCTDIIDFLDNERDIIMDKDEIQNLFAMEEEIERIRDEYNNKIRFYNKSLEEINQLNQELNINL